MIKIDSLTIEELKKEMVKLNEPSFRAKQIFEWIHKKNVSSFQCMHNISNNSKQKYIENFEFTSMRVLQRFDSKLDETKKYLMLLEDGNIIETVYLKYKYGSTLCISSQVGCKMGCMFCASTKNGFIRNLTVGELLNQIYVVQKDICEKIGNIVIMGTGEPFENFNNIIKFFNLINDEKGQNLSLRKITVSTCGIVPKIYEFSDLNLQVTLAISLHVANQTKRQKIMPVSVKYDLNELIDACKYYVKKTNKRITFEYILIDGFNDSYDDAIKLSKYLEGLLCNINLIPYNSIKENSINASTNNNINNFKKYLLNNNLNVTVRRELGNDINAACGQLRNDYLNKRGD